MEREPPTYCAWSDLTESEEGTQAGRRRGASGTEGSGTVGAGSGAAVWTHACSTDGERRVVRDITADWCR